MLAVPPWLSNASFTKIGVFFIQNDSNLTPSDCKIRQIADLGSVLASAEQPGVDLLQREVIVISPYAYIAQAIFCRIATAVATAGVLVIGAPLGVLWHLGAVVYHALGAIRNGRHLTGLEQHGLALAQDFLAALPTLTFFVSKICAAQGIALLTPGTLMTPIAALVLMAAASIATVEIAGLLALPVLPRETLSYWFDFEHSVLMKTQFGLVGKTGELLTPGPKTDTHDPYGFEPHNFRGLFSDLRKKNAEKLVNEIKHIAQQLPLVLSYGQAYTFSEYPEKILHYLKKHSLPNDFSWDVLEKAIEADQILRDCLNVLFFEETIPQFFDTYELARFLDDLQSYYPRNFQNREVDADIKKDFISQLKGFQSRYNSEHEKSWWEEFREVCSDEFLAVLDQIYLFFSSSNPEAPSFDLETIKKRIHSAADPYTVLGLPIGDLGAKQAVQNLSPHVNGDLLRLINAAQKVIEEHAPSECSDEDDPFAGIVD